MAIKMNLDERDELFTNPDAKAKQVAEVAADAANGWLAEVIPLAIDRTLSSVLVVAEAELMQQLPDAEAAPAIRRALQAVRVAQVGKKIPHVVVGDPGVLHADERGRVVFSTRCDLDGMRVTLSTNTFRQADAPRDPQPLELQLCAKVSQQTVRAVIRDPVTSLISELRESTILGP